MPITTYQNGQSDLELAPRDLTVLVAPYLGNPKLTTLEDDTDGSLLIPAYYISSGNFTKRGGVRLGNNPDITDVESHGKATPTRQLPTKRPITIGFEPQETHRYNLERYWGADWSGVTPTAFGGVAMVVPDLPLNLKYRVILLGWDDFEGEDIYLYWLGNKANVSKTEDQEMVDSDVLRYPYTLNCQSDGGSPLTVGICGPGWQTLQASATTGFTS